MSKGIMHMLLAVTFFAFMQVCVKLVAHIPAIEVVFFRSLISLVLSLFFLLRVGKNPFGHAKNRWLLLARGSVGAAALVLFFITLQKIPLASAVTLQFLSPIFTTLLGIWIVGERISGWQLFFFGLSFAGVVLIKGFDADLPLTYLAMGLIASLLAGLAYNIIRTLKNSEDPLVIIFYFPLVTLPISGIWSATTWVMPVAWDWLLLLLVGVFTQVAQYFMTISYQNEEMNKVAALKYLGIVYALIFGYVLFDEALEPMVFIGIATVLAGVILNYLYKEGHILSRFSAKVESEE